MGLKRAFFFKELCEGFISELAVKYYDGKHPKHFLWVDHYKFITNNINPGEKVMDIGCGASLSYNLELAKNQIVVDAVDINPALIQKCKTEKRLENINFRLLDITKELPDQQYDTVILSHILEHLSDPAELLRKLHKITQKIILRLPRYDDH
ncbi:MAG: class I SAM-dependent methyltransferase [Promethearchaeota archaeon]